MLSEAIEESVEHLRPWMPWANKEPLSLASRIQLLRRFRGQFDLGMDFVYGIFSSDESTVLGGSGLHTRLGEGVREIGFWIRARETGQGYATEATMALTLIAFELEKIPRLEIRCDADNRASAAVARKAGFRFEGTLRSQTAGVDGERRDTMVWSLLPEDEMEGARPAFDLSAYDGFGARLL